MFYGLAQLLRRTGEPNRARAPGSVDDSGKRFDLACPLMLVDCFAVPSQQGQVASVPVPAKRIVGVQSQGALKFFFCIRPIPVIPGMVL